jgi:ADP-ribose pyrophosphatase YjhB (NUDIX family)
MWKKYLAALWRRAPRSVRLWSMRLINPHFTVTVGAVVQDERGRVLLFNHVFRKGSGWGIPGGFLNRGEQPEEGLRRELCEEADVELEEAELAFVRTHEKPQQVEIIFRCRARHASVGELQSGEIRSTEWFELTALPDELSRDQRRLIKRALKTVANEGE